MRLSIVFTLSLIGVIVTANMTESLVIALLTGKIVLCFSLGVFVPRRGSQTDLMFSGRKIPQVESLGINW